MERGIWIYILLVIAAVGNNICVAEEGPPAVFIFGDSMVDVGTNNFLQHCGTKADSPYYGIDSPFSKPTGRFSNGQNVADLIVKHLEGGNYKRSPPPFLFLINRMSSFKSAVLHGVNFASGGSGIFDATGNITFTEVVPLRKQIEQFATVCANITEVLGKSKADYLISKALYIISVGSNDIFEYAAHPSVLPDIFMANLIESYTTSLQELYSLGAKRFGILSVGAIGCVPFIRYSNKSDSDNGDCVDQVNDLAQAFYKVTLSILSQLSSNLPGFYYSFGNIYEITMSTILNAVADGFTETKLACCGNGTQVCKTGVTLCDNRKEYLFWDRFHPTEAASLRVARILVFSEAAQFVTPINISQLVAMP